MMVSSDNGTAALAEGIRMLEAGATALDVVEHCAKLVEAVSPSLTAAPFASPLSSGDNLRRSTRQAFV